MKQTGPDIFSFIYSSATDRVTYGLAVVPPRLAVQVEYLKPSLRIEVVLKPSMPSHWQVEGLVDEDIVSNIGLSVTRRRIGRTKPLVTDSDIDKNQELGTFYRIDEALFWIDCLIPPASVTRFFDIMWNPANVLRNAGIYMPPICLLDRASGMRVLPQKIVRTKNGVESTLLVKRQPAGR